MKTNRCFHSLVLGAAALSLAVLNTQAQTKVLANPFNNADEVLDTARNGGDAWRNWFGAAYYQAVWDSSDASNNAASGSLKVEAYFPDAGIGGSSGAQFHVMNGFNGYTNATYPLGFPGNGNSTLGIPLVTNVEFDIRFDVASAYDTNNNLWPWIEVGTRGTGDSPLPWSQYSSYSHDVTGWQHRSFPISENSGWSYIPNIYFKHWHDSSWNNSEYVAFYIDNITFTFKPAEEAPTVLPSLGVTKAEPALRMISGNSQYNRIQLATVDTNQSWVGGTYPVSYSFTISDVDAATSLNEFHVFLVPLNHNQGGLGAINQYTDYSTASNNFRLQISGGAVGSTVAYANLSWKTNLVNANPNQVALQITNDVIVGTWTLAFNSANTGTLTAPGAAPAPFSIPADAAATFANPVVAFFGVQPNPTEAIGQYVDVTHIQTAGVAAPGVPVNTTFGSGAIDTNIWRTASVSADGGNLIVAGANAAYWLSWATPDYNSALVAAADLAAPASQWKVPAYYAGSSTGIVKKVVGSRAFTLLPTSAMPTVNGQPGGAPASSAFFRLLWPAPTQ
jgi:hypothetical protein